MMNTDINKYCSNSLCPCGSFCSCAEDNCKCGNSKECKNCHLKCENCTCNKNLGENSSSFDNRPPGTIFTSEFFNDNRESLDSPFRQQKLAKMEFYPTADDEAKNHPRRLHSPSFSRTATTTLRHESPMQIQTTVDSPRNARRRKSFNQEESYDSPLRHRIESPLTQQEPLEKTTVIPPPQHQQQLLRDESPSQILRRHHGLNRSVESYSFARAPRSTNASPQHRRSLVETTMESIESPLASPTAARRRPSTTASQQSTINIPIIRDDPNDPILRRCVCTGLEDCQCAECVALRSRKR